MLGIWASLPTPYKVVEEGGLEKLGYSYMDNIFFNGGFEFDNYSINGGARFNRYVQVEESEFKGGEKKEEYQSMDLGVFEYKTWWSERYNYSGGQDPHGAIVSAAVNGELFLPSVGDGNMPVGSGIPRGAIGKIVWHIWDIESKVDGKLRFGITDSGRLYTGASSYFGIEKYNLPYLTIDTDEGAPLDLESIENNGEGGGLSYNETDFTIEVIQKLFAFHWDNTRGKNYADDDGNTFIDTEGLYGNQAIRVGMYRVSKSHPPGNYILSNIVGNKYKVYTMDWVETENPTSSGSNYRPVLCLELRSDLGNGLTEYTCIYHVGPLWDYYTIGGTERIYDEYGNPINLIPYDYDLGGYVGDESVSFDFNVVLQRTGDNWKLFLNEQLLFSYNPHETHPSLPRIKYGVKRYGSVAPINRFYIGEKAMAFVEKIRLTPVSRYGGPNQPALPTTNFSPYPLLKDYCPDDFDFFTGGENDFLITVAYIEQGNEFEPRNSSKVVIGLLGQHAPENTTGSKISNLLFYSRNLYTAKGGDFIFAIPTYSLARADVTAQTGTIDTRDFVVSGYMPDGFTRMIGSPDEDWLREDGKIEMALQYTASDRKYSGYFNGHKVFEVIANVKPVQYTCRPAFNPKGYTRLYKDIAPLGESYEPFYDKLPASELASSIVQLG